MKKGRRKTEEGGKGGGREEVGDKMKHVVPFLSNPLHYPNTYAGVIRLDNTNASDVCHVCGLLSGVQPAQTP